MVLVLDLAEMSGKAELDYCSLDEMGALHERVLSPSSGESRLCELFRIRIDTV